MPDTTSRRSFKNLVTYLDAHHRLVVSFIISIIGFLVAQNRLPVTEVVLITWMCFAFSLIVLQWIVILSSHPRDMRHLAGLEDSSRTFIFLFVVAASLISLLAIVFLLKSGKDASADDITRHVIITTGSVITSWWLVHTVFTLRYAHLYYDTTTDDGGTKPAGGLQFPDEPEPDYLDFVYFSFVIGMTFQVSDVEIASRKMRRLAWVHGLISFAFNTAIVALSINIISGLVSQH
ncbi:DUF1345 domain-containing protein [Mucilaginibacter sp. Bleaf8]|uniref:DUF1345 domain-containing protein n=1 Tax=Mucilaginibacter sp. Bleaf8 TaxID=2834430 RepID=UPI001BCC5F69|nr:DUF1345 domain-containing protein [Mucilaginibacter sp. Bleaf8]MBS7565045.1 DUF1345 domain-containing protein [Mucilaginibacter sp. Bleaf8]